MDQVRLIVIAQLRRERRPRDGRAGGHALRGLVNPGAPEDPFRPHADVALERAVERAHRHAGDPGQILGSVEVAVVLRARRERHGLGERGIVREPVRAQEVFDHASREGVVRLVEHRSRERIARACKGFFERHDAIDEPAHRDAREGEEPARLELGGDDAACPLEPRDLAPGPDAVHRRAPRLDREVHAGVGQDLLLEGLEE